ncbi:hypothetical protein [Actinomadura flavalba]|uniref:hypothetical protein n=1 Tax=Actinomadura flavalba TaxID=1120938 RepID=UPI0003A4BDC8|nr:hypothetical protein [Actinomadura flavalba]
MPSSIPVRRRHGHRHVRTRSLRALAVAARLERHDVQDGPPGPPPSVPERETT